MNKQYDNKVLTLFRIMSITAALILLITIIFSFYSLSKDTHYAIRQITINSIVICFLVLVAIFPAKFGLLSIPVFYYAFLILIWQPGNFMGVLMYALGVLLLALRGLLKKNKKLKITGLSICYIALVLSELRFGWKFCSKNFIEILGYTFISMLIISVSYLLFHEYTLKPEDKILNLAKYEKLNKDDLVLLTKIQEGKRYKEIASDTSKTEGTVRNRLNKVYKIIESGDRTGFLSSFGDWKLIWEEDVKLPETPPQSYSSLQKSEES